MAVRQEPDTGASAPRHGTERPGAPAGADRDSTTGAPPDRHAVALAAGGGVAGTVRPPVRTLGALQRTAGNRAVSGLLTAAPRPDQDGAAVQRTTLTEGPPLAPGNYRYGDTIVSLDERGMRTVLKDMAAAKGLVAERQWQQRFVADMRAVSKPRSFDDPATKQTVSVEPMLATRAERGQDDLDREVQTVQTQFQQQMLGSVRTVLDRSEKQVQGEARRYGFPDDRSVLQPQPLTAGQATILGAMPESAELTKLTVAAKELLDGKRKLAKVRQQVTGMGPFVGEAARPTVLQPALLEYHGLRARKCGEFPMLAAVERDEAKLAELAGNAQLTGPGAGAPARTSALVTVREQVRKELADKLTNIAYVRSRMDEQDRVERFWLDAGLRASTKRSLSIADNTLADRAVADRVRQISEDAEFQAKLKAALGIGLLILSFVPGMGLVAGAAGLAMGASDVLSAFQDYFWEEAATGTAFEKAEAISQSDPSLFGLGVSIAYGLLEGVAEAKALEGAIGVFKAVRGVYQEARAAALVAKSGSGTAKAAASAEFLAAREKVRATADAASGRPGLGDRILADLPADITAHAQDVDAAVAALKNPELQQLVRNGKKIVTLEGRTLQELVVEDLARLERDFADWKSGGAKEPFEDFVKRAREPMPYQKVNYPLGLIEEGLDAAGARRSYEASLAEDPTREVGIWRDPQTGERVCVQGAPGFVETGWMRTPENLRNGRIPQWELELHHHPARGVRSDALPSGDDFQSIMHWQLADGRPRAVRSTLTYIDPRSKLRFQTEFGYVPGAPRPFWARYRVDDGSFKIATFEKAPFGDGAAEYGTFLQSFTADAAAPVPGGNLHPVPRPGPVPRFDPVTGLPVQPAAPPRVVAEDVTTGPHGPQRPLADIVSRAWQVNPQTGKINGPQGRWLSGPLAEQAIADLDVPNMVVGRAYSVPIAKGAGEVVRPYNEYPDRGLPKSQRFIRDPADRALVIRMADDRIHTFPIGAEHKAYGVPAPVLPTPAPTP